MLGTRAIGTGAIGTGGGSSAPIINASTTLAGVIVLARVGALSTIGRISAHADVTGVGALAYAGVVAPAAGVRVAMVGAAAFARVGLLGTLAGNPASVTLASTRAGADVGSFAFIATASVIAAGIIARARVGAAIPSVPAAATLPGARANGRCGALIGSVPANASMPGAITYLRAGSVLPQLGAFARLRGVGAGARVGAMSAAAAANAILASVAAGARVGGLLPVVPASSRPSGVGAPARVGALSLTAGVGLILDSMIARIMAGRVTAGGVNGNGLARVMGAAFAMRASPMTVSASVNGVTMNTTEDMLCAAVRAYIMSVADGLRVIRTPVNRASMPVGDYVSFTPGLRRPLSTSFGEYATNARQVHRSDQMTFQIDCYGKGAADLAERLNVLYRDEYAVESFAASGLDIAPLYAGEVMQAPFTNDADQYEDRYTFQIEVQVNERVTVKQQTSIAAVAELVSVDANFPPTEDDQ